MARSSQAHLFETQAEMFAPEPAPVYRPDLDKVRRRLNKILAEARAAQSLPWDPLSLYRTIFPQMTLFLPEGEGAQFRLEFDSELKRLEGM
jgi:hypothetical protein